MDLRRGVVIISVISALLIPTYLLAADDTPPASPPAAPSDDAIPDNGSNTNTLENQKTNAGEIADKVNELCGYIPGKLIAVAEKKTLTGDKLSTFNANMASIDEACGSLKNFNAGSIKTESEYRKAIDQYKDNFGKFSKNVTGAIKLLEG